LALFGSTKSASFECKFESGGGWAPIGPIYYCEVQNAVNITTLDASQVDDIFGTHKTGYNNDNVDLFSVGQGQVHYFPRSLNNFFKNLKGIEIYNTGLKEIHQRDLKDFPRLEYIGLQLNNLEIIEENLFEFNPNLEHIYVGYNKITHIDPNVFDRLTKLYVLYIQATPCINMFAYSPTGVQEIITSARARCTNSDYSNLEQKVKYLEFESKILNSEILRAKLEKLENEIKNSNFPNFFQDKLQAIKATLIEKEREDAQDLRISQIEEKLEQIIETINNKNEDMNTI